MPTGRTEVPPPNPLAPGSSPTDSLLWWQLLLIAVAAVGALLVGGCCLMCVAYCLFRGFGRSVDGGASWRKGKGQVAPEDAGAEAGGWAGAWKGVAGNLAAGGVAGGAAAVVAVSGLGVTWWVGGVEGRLEDAFY